MWACVYAFFYCCFLIKPVFSEAAAQAIVIVCFVRESECQTFIKRNISSGAKFVVQLSALSYRLNLTFII